MLKESNMFEILQKLNSIGPIRNPEIHGIMLNWLGIFFHKQLSFITVTLSYRPIGTYTTILGNVMRQKTE